MNAELKSKISFYDATSILEFSLPKLVRIPEIHLGHFARAERYNCVEPGHRIKKQSSPRHRLRCKSINLW
jgi:hypothetical protein